MKTFILPAAAALLLTSAPTWAGPQHNTTTHRTVHVTTHTNNHATHVTRTVRVNRTVRTPHAGSWHGNTWHGTTHAKAWHARSGVHVHINIGGLHANINAPHRYHFGTYTRPSGWYAHRWTYGQHLPRGWYARNYWIANYVTFGLVAPPDGYEWVRVGNDALLIDVDSGEVIRVVYDVFY